MMNSQQQLTHAGIEALIPHRGAMCLLARLDKWDDEHIVCHADNHRNPLHPLRTRSGLLSSALIEYAAQAMALHGALRSRASGAAARGGMLASARGVQLCSMHLDALPPASPDELQIIARHEASDARQLLYGFSAFHADTLLAKGRISVVLEVGGPTAP